MTLLAAVFHLCTTVNPERAEEVCISSSMVAIANTIRLEARRYHLDPFVVAALIQHESAFDLRATSTLGALGLMQLLRGTAATRQYEHLTDRQLEQPRLNIRLGCKHLAMWRRFCGGSLEHALTVYSGRGRCRASSYSETILRHARRVKRKARS